MLAAVARSMGAAMADAPTIDLSAFTSCTLPLQVDQVDYAVQPTLEQDAGRVGSEVRVEGEGFLASADQAATSGVDFKVMGFGGAVVHQVLAAGCLEGGPHVSFQVMRAGSGPNHRRVRFGVSARTVPSTLVSAYRYRMGSGPDGLQRVGQAGRSPGPARRPRS